MSLHLVFDGDDPTSFRCDDCGATSYFDVSLPAVKQMSAFTLGHPCRGPGDTSASLGSRLGNAS